MPLELRMQKKLDGYCWVIQRGKHRLATSGRFYKDKRMLRLALIGLVKSIQADNFDVYDDTEDVSLQTARKRNSKAFQARRDKAARTASGRRSDVPVQLR